MNTVQSKMEAKMKSKKNRYGCAVLAGGKGRRMGSRNKASLELAGENFLARITREMDKSGMPCYLSAASYAQECPEGWTLVEDSVRGYDGGFVGPLGGITSCLLAARENGLDGLFFSPCDAPFYKEDLIEELKMHLDDSLDALIWSDKNNRLQPIFGFYSINCIEPFRKAIAAGNYKLMRALEALRTEILQTEEELAFTNVNTPEDYEAMKERGNAIESN